MSNDTAIITGGKRMVYLIPILISFIPFGIYIYKSSTTMSEWCKELPPK